MSIEYRCAQDRAPEERNVYRTFFIFSALLYVLCGSAVEGRGKLNIEPMN